MEYFFILIASVLVCALLVVAALKTMNLPVVPAYFIAGMIMGPGGIGLLESGEEADFVAELGIIFLLFTVGLQFNLAALKSLRTFVFVLGGIQVFGTAAVVAGVARFYTDGWLLASLVGFVAMLSPTAVIGQILLQNNAVNSPVGRRAVGVLLFQDFLTIPLIIIYSSGGDVDVSWWVTVPLVALKISVILGVVFFAAPRVVKIWLDWTAVRGDKEMFVLSIVALIAGSALATGYFELTYVLGPFLAGILIAETAHRENVEHMMEPFRHLLMGFFFIAVGMLIDGHFVLDHLGRIAGLAAAMWAIKVPLMYVAARAVKTHRATALRTAFLMGGGGPFGFVLLVVAKDSGIIPKELFELLVAANILALVATPFVWAQTDKIVNFLFPDDVSISARKAAENAAKADKMQNHTVICGYGRTGQSIAGILRGVPADFIGIDNNHVIIEMVGDVEPLIYGEGHEQSALIAAGIRRAAILNITIGEPVVAAAAAKAARKLNPNIHIIAKAASPRQARDLQEAGADQTLVEAHQCGMSMAGQTLRRFPELSQEKVASLFKQARYRDNPLFQGQYLGTSYSEVGGKSFVGCVVGPGGDGVSPAEAGKDVTIVMWRRGEAQLDPENDGPLKSGDKLILTGGPRELRRAKEALSGE